MGLKQNTTLLAQMPLRHLGGAVGTLRPMWGRTDLRNQSVGQGIPSKLAGIPSGHLAPSSWVLPYKPGAMSSFTNPYISPGASGAGMLRWNSGMNCMEVNDGNSWQQTKQNLQP